MSRSVGLKRDLRLSKLETYSNYYFLNFRSFLGQHGDSYDRFLIRMNEMAESLNIINQVIYKITKHQVTKQIKNKNSTNISPHNILKYTHPSH
jgi:NADH:ubiquinone oxidoreductase subunit D